MGHGDLDDKDATRTIAAPYALPPPGSRRSSSFARLGSDVGRDTSASFRTKANHRLANVKEFRPSPPAMRTPSSRRLYEDTPYVPGNGPVFDVQECSAFSRRRPRT